jgi:hypothetical protein
MMGCDMACIGIIDVAPVVRGYYTTHGLNLNSRGKRRLAHLTDEKISGGHVSSVSSIPIITHATALPCFILKSKAQRYLTCIECNYLHFKFQSKNI